jgi:acyl dehydratase
MYYYGDLEVGDVYETGVYSITKEELVMFAEQFDPQPFHVDEEAAQESMFGGLVVSGLHTLCLSVRLFITEFIQGEEGVANMGGSGMDELRWHKPVRPGDTLHVRVKIVEKKISENRSDRGYIDFNLRAFTDGEEAMSVVLHNIVKRSGDVD